MKLFKSFFIGIIICLSAISCDKDDVNPGIIEITGTFQKVEGTIYQYGTHRISGYAIRSNSVTLDDYVNQSVAVFGHKIDGYPLDGGSDYVEVEEIK